MDIDQDLLTSEEHEYLAAVLGERGRMPDLEGVWKLMDEAWAVCRCDTAGDDSLRAKFYAHPVWLLNGLFIEQHEESLSLRRKIVEYVVNLKPKRIADFGGGYGTLARMIGASCPATEVHVVEPHPHAAAITLAGKTANVRYVDDFQGNYDVLIATDVFEHVDDPLALVERTAAHLWLGGEYLMANCFWPVIHCHLPATFHFRWSWHAAMAAMGLRPGNAVAYGRAYRKAGPVACSAARCIERRSRYWFELVEKLPYRCRGLAARLLVPRIG